MGNFTLVIFMVAAFQNQPNILDHNAVVQGFETMELCLEAKEEIKQAFFPTGGVSYLGGQQGTTVYGACVQTANLPN